MSKNLTREEKDAIMHKATIFLRIAILNYELQESMHGRWLPQKYRTNPARWLEVVSDVASGVEEYNDEYADKRTFLQKVMSLWNTYRPF